VRATTHQSARPIVGALGFVLDRVTEHRGVGRAPATQNVVAVALLASAHN
jgi:hypothetical protein